MQIVLIGCLCYNKVECLRAFGEIGKLKFMEEKKMKEYKMVYLNKGIAMSREKDLENAASTLNECIVEGWTLQQVVSPTDGIGALVAVLYKGE